MINNNQNGFNSNSTTLQPLVPPIKPIFQASPSGGVVATLQPGQKGFDDIVKTESDRKDGFTQQDILTQSKNVNNGFKLPEINEVNYRENAAMADLQAQKEKEKLKKGPASVSEYKVGKGLEKKAAKKWLFPVIASLVGLTVVGAAAFYFWDKANTQSAPKPVVVENTILNYWGLWEPSSVLTQVLKDFETQNPGVSVSYAKKNINGYREELQQALASQNGPDIFRYHASWRSYLNDQLDAMPETLMTSAQFAQDFYPVFSEQLKNAEGNVQGIPLMYDSLALLYNKDAYAEVNLEVPKTWSEFAANAYKLTKKSETGYIEQAGAAMGLGDNIDFAPDIVGLLATQSGIDLANPDQEKLQEVLDYYTSFYNDTSERVWDSDFDNSSLAFARGEVAMVFAPSWMIHDILAINPNLNIGIASVPQLNVAEPTEWATYWVEGVNNKSPRKVAAWNLLEYLSSEPVLEALNKEQEALRNFGEIYPRPNMADLLATNSYVQPYLVNADKAVGFPLNDKTFDQALDDANKESLLLAINELTGKNKRDEDLAKVTFGLIEDWLANLNEYGYQTTSEDMLVQN